MKEATRRKHIEASLEKMRGFIETDLIDGRSRLSIAGSLAIPVEHMDRWMIKNGLKDLYGEPIQ